MKELKKLALKELKQSKFESYEEICNSIISYSQNDLFIEAKKLLLENIKKLDKRGIINDKSPFLLLKSISKYLYNLSISQEYSQTLKDEIKGLIKQIRIILKYLEKNYNENFLLIENEKQFLAIENALFLNSADELSTVLNHTNYIKEADKFFMLKSKVELGFSRYLFNQKNKILIEKFDKEGNIKLPLQISFLKIINEYLPEEILFKDFEKKIIKWDFNNELEEKLLYLKILKIKNKNKFTKELNKIKKLLKEFPEFVWDKNFTKQYFEISKSINKENQLKSKNHNKNKVLVNLNSIKTINLVIQILK